jgi:hypothetical protein
MNQVLTTKGLIDLASLDIKDCVEVGDNYRKVATEYYFNGELVRRDVTASALRGLGSESAPGQIG